MNADSAPTFSLMTTPFVAVQYEESIVGLSFMIASLASYVALDLAKRVRNHDSVLAHGWWFTGSIAMGTGIWATHFVGMLAMSAPFSMGFAYGATGLSWVAAVAASATALYIAAHAQLTYARLAAGALVMGGGISAMHYIGMMALDMTPAIEWTAGWVLLSIAIAIATSTVALWVFFELQKLKREAARLGQAAAALVMGLAICGMHYSGMAAASFPTASICRSASELGGDRLEWLVAGATLLLLTQTMFNSMMDTRMQRNALDLETSWQTKATSLQKLAFRDALTGLPNRLLLDDRLSLAVERSLRDNKKLAVLFIDLDGFKPINDTYGHRFGDAVLIEMARRLASHARATGTVARVGGDEFVVLLEGDTDTQAITGVAQRIIDDLGLPFQAGERDIRLACSVGIATFPNGAPWEELIAHADAAMYTAKRSGGAAYVFFGPGMVDASGGLKPQGMDM